MKFQDSSYEIQLNIIWNTEVCPVDQRIRSILANGAKKGILSSQDSSRFRNMLGQYMNALTKMTNAVNKVTSEQRFLDTDYVDQYVREIIESRSKDICYYSEQLELLSPVSNQASLSAQDLLPTYKPEKLGNMQLALSFFGSSKVVSISDIPEDGLFPNCVGNNTVSRNKN